MAKKKRDAEPQAQEPETGANQQEPQPQQETQPRQETQPQQETQAAAADQPDPVKELKSKCDEYLAMAQRAQADFENYKRRNESAKAQAYADGLAQMITAMLPVMDNFERALGSTDENTDAKALLQGVEMVKKQLGDVFAAQKCEPIPSPKGGAFDPAVHNAIMTTPQEEGFEPGTIAATFQKGYRIGEKVIRYAMVSVFEQ